jgi:hypothetical protein
LCSTDLYVRLHVHGSKQAREAGTDAEQGAAIDEGEDEKMMKKKMMKK